MKKLFIGAVLSAVSFSAIASPDFSIIKENIYTLGPVKLGETVPEYFSKVSREEFLVEAHKDSIKQCSGFNADSYADIEDVSKNFFSSTYWELSENKDYDSQFFLYNVDDKKYYVITDDIGRIGYAVRIAPGTVNVESVKNEVSNKFLESARLHGNIDLSTITNKYPSETWSIYKFNTRKHMPVYEIKISSIGENEQLHFTESVSTPWFYHFRSKYEVLKIIQTDIEMNKISKYVHDKYGVYNYSNSPIYSVKNHFDCKINETSMLYPGILHKVFDHRYKKEKSRIDYNSVKTEFDNSWHSAFDGFEIYNLKSYQYYIKKHTATE